MHELINEEKSIISCHDFELGVERKEKLFYKYSYLSSQKLKGIVFLIHGFGAQSSYMDNLREFAAREFSVVAVDVYYHCFFSRFENGATLEFDSFDISILNQLIEQYDINLTPDDTKTVDLVLNKLNNEVARLKAIDILETNFKLQLPMTLVPKNNEYQNFGVMQAIDHINVLHEIEKLSFDFIDNYAVSLVGSSHGGYLAHLIAKFAPHKIDFVIDNSSYAKIPLPFILGKDINISSPENVIIYKHLKLNAFVKKYWTKNANSPYFFSPVHANIRYLGNQEHIAQIANSPYNKTIFISYHSSKDTLAEIKYKIEFYQKLKENNFNATLHIIDDISQVDGKFIKNLEHGMDMSLKELAKREIPKCVNISPKNHIIDYELSYKCDNQYYIFSYSKNNLKVKINKS